MTRAALILFALAARTGVASAAPIDPEQRARARAADDSAREHYDLREYEAAIADYKRAFEALRDPLFLFDIAQAYRQLHDCDSARVFYRNYLREAPAADNRAQVEKLVGEMDACVAAQPPQPPQPPQQQPDDSPPQPPPAALPDQALSRRSLYLIDAALAVGGLAIGGVGVAFSVRAADDGSQLERACTPGCTAASVAAIDSAGRGADRDAILAYAGAAALLVGSVAMYIAIEHSGPEPVAVIPTRGGAMVSAQVRF